MLTYKTHTHTHTPTGKYTHNYACVCIYLHTYISCMLSSQIHRLSRAPICTTVPYTTNPHVHALTGKAITMFHLNTDETIPYESTHLVLTLSVTHTLLQHGPFLHKQLGVSGQSAHSNLWTSWFRLLRKLLEIPLPRGGEGGSSLEYTPA